ncbi:cysteine--tRNA ligase [Candidatus Absconditicoccus praedator]|uniref:cysteine--tRNA ligase n=1 Tax=Candidatus Absconditicoccus praedator TaxID=2735562 RepID=UPI001E4F3036|nr:cysteine--tRNA ligase [Candidatus Absconditicoccus praedator]UFX82866.1 cysteine--tRNA ligase [Candidatus Absconditicoccus praedator]
MDFFVYNTLTREKEKFEPFFNKEKDYVAIYTCGPTVYSMPHIGNLRSFVFAGLLSDVIRNVLGYKVLHTINITDVGHLTDDADSGEDKLEKAATKQGKTAWDIASYYEGVFKDIIKKLHLNFDNFPRATDYIQQQIEIIQQLEDQGLVYKIEGDGIYLDTSKVDDYGKLIGPNRDKFFEGLRDGARVDVGGKKNPTDFALWKFSPSGEKRHMEWDSPWGVGFPGWHIECSAMSKCTLGKNIDIHTGGTDHIQTHHTNEIVQSEYSFADNHPWVKYWMHCSFLQLKNGKISKSAGDTLSLPELENKGFESEDFRYFLLSGHYRSFLDFDWSFLYQSKQTRHNLAKKLSLFKHIRTVNSSGLTYSELEKKLDTKDAKDFLRELSGSILDDLNTPSLLAAINKYIGSANYEMLMVLHWFDKNVLKINVFDLAISILDKKVSLKVPDYIKQMAHERFRYKQEGNYKKADEIRDKINEQGYMIVDKPNGYDVQHKSLEV